ncbi:MAG TPA: hypothetical protein VG755_28355 [Nannocystaceae bacterium]|nr:hypothetical protein [Nannocystaceae bacterium]
MRSKLAVVVIGWLSACSVDAGRHTSTGATECTPGTVIACNCPDGSPSTAACGIEMFYGPCMCAAATEPGSGSESGSSAAADEQSSGEASGDTTAASTGCDGSIFFGEVDGVPSLWSEGGQTGLAAGTAMCQSIGGDHVCDYEEVLMAEAAGELAGMVNSSAWIHRTTIALVDGVPSAPSPGGRCVDWTYDMDTLADGEWVDFTADGLVYNLDPDTFYDGLDASHADPMALPCAGTNRAVLCCNAPC